MEDTGKKTYVPPSVVTTEPAVPPQPEETYRQPEAGLSVQIPKDRRLMIHAPGWMNVAKDGGGYPGCRLVSITTALGLDGTRRLVVDGLEPDDGAKFLEEMAEERVDSPIEAVNLYYKHRANLLTVMVQPFVNGVLIAHTNNLEGSRLDYFREASRRVAREMETWEQEEQAKQQKEFEEQEARTKELNRLAELGAKAEKADLFMLSLRMSKKLKRMRAELFKLGGKEAVEKAGLEDLDASDE